MSGKAMLTIVASTNAMTPPSDAIARTVRGSGPRRRDGGGATTVGAGAGSAVVVAIEPGSFLDRQTRCQLGGGLQRLDGGSPAHWRTRRDGVPLRDGRRPQRAGVR